MGRNQQSRPQQLHDDTVHMLQPSSNPKRKDGTKGLIARTTVIVTRPVCTVENHSSLQHLIFVFPAVAFKPVKCIQTSREEKTDSRTFVAVTFCIGLLLTEGKSVFALKDDCLSFSTATLFSGSAHNLHSFIITAVNKITVTNVKIMRMRIFR